MKPSVTPATFSDDAIGQIISDISPILDVLPAGMTVIVENLFPRHVWKGMSIYTRSVIGQQIVHLVKTREIRLQFPEDSDEAVQRYIVT